MPGSSKHIRRRHKEDVLAVARASLEDRLNARRTEIEDALATRLGAVASPVWNLSSEQPEYRRQVLGAAFDYMLVAIDQGEKRTPGVPLDLLMQARSAARHSVPLELVLRQFFAGYSVLAESVFREAQNDASVTPSALRQLLEGHSALLDRLIEAVSDEYRREAENIHQSREKRSADRIKRLLAGEMLDTSDIDYDLEDHHVAAIGRGHGASKAAYDLSRQVDRRLLLIPSEYGVWAWFGGRTELNAVELVRLASNIMPPDTAFAFGEAARGLAGWRLTHFQAKAAHTVARHSDLHTTGYGDVALLAAILKDELLYTSLQHVFLAPLDSQRDGGAAARETLRAYFQSDRNVSSAAVRLGVKRHTVTRRLRAVEERLGRTLANCANEIEIALSLETLEGMDDNWAPDSSAS